MNNILMNLLGLNTNTDQNMLMGSSGVDMDKLRQLIQMQQMLQQKPPQIQMPAIANAPMNQTPIANFPAMQQQQSQQQQMNPLMMLYMAATRNQLGSAN